MPGFHHTLLRDRGRLGALTVVDTRAALAGALPYAMGITRAVRWRGWEVLRGPGHVVGSFGLSCVSQPVRSPAPARIVVADAVSSQPSTLVSEARAALVARRISELVGISCAGRHSSPASLSAWHVVNFSIPDEHPVGEAQPSVRLGRRGRAVVSGCRGLQRVVWAIRQSDTRRHTGAYEPPRAPRGV